MSETTAAPRSGKLLPAVLVLNSALLAGVLGMLVLKPAGAAPHAAADKHAAAEPAAPAAEGHGAAESHEPGVAAAGLMGPTVKLPDFVIHLRDTEADRYARLSFEVEVGNEKDKADLTARLAVIRDVFISYLSDRTLEELRGSEGLTHTKAALLQKLSGTAPTAHVRGLYVTDLVMQ